MTVSVVITCYNYAHFLPESVRSVLDQTYRDFEIIIVDDGSTDDTSEVASRIVAERTDGRIRLIRQENSGASAARNKGIDEAKGEYILPLDADDLIRPTYLEKTVAAVGADPFMTACTWTEKFGMDEGIIKPGGLGRFDAIRLTGPPSTFLFSKQAWEKAGGYNPAMKWGGEDWEFNCSMHEAGCGCAVIPEPLFLWRKHGVSRTTDMVGQHSLETQRTLRLLHPSLFEPSLSRVSPSLAKTIIWLKHWTRDPLSRYLYLRHPGLHRRLSDIKYRLLAGGRRGA